MGKKGKYHRLQNLYAKKFSFFIFLLVLISIYSVSPVRSEIKFTAMDWKDGKDAVVCISFDWEDDYPHSIYMPNRTADLRGDLPEKTDRILRILDRRNVKATFFVVGIVAEEFRDSFDQIRMMGHEIASHGDFHRGYYQMGIEDRQGIPYFGEQSFEEQVTRIEKAEKLMKFKPAGFRAPGLNFNNETLLALESMGYNYDSSLQTTDKIRPFHPPVNNESLSLLEIPVTSGKDAFSWDLYGRKYDRPDTSEQWKKDFEEIYKSGGVYIPLFHPAFIGKDPRLLETLEEFIGYTQDYDIWMTTLNDLAKWYTDKERLHITVRNPRGAISLLEIENNGNRIEGLTIKVEGRTKAVGENISVNHTKGEEKDSTRITFKVLEKGKTRVILFRF